MRFTIAREKLQEGLGAVAASVPAKTTLPVLANLLVETTDRGIRLSGTDLDMAVSTELMADVDVQGAITIPARSSLRLFVNNRLHLLSSALVVSKRLPSSV